MDLKRKNFNLIVSASSDNLICLWNLNIEKPSAYLAGHTNDVLRVIDLKAFNEDFIASCSADNNVKIWSLKEARTVKKLIGHTNFVKGMIHIKEFSKELVLSYSADTTIRLWNISSTIEEVKEEFCFKGHKDIISQLIYPKLFNVNYFISAGQDLKIYLWEITFQKNKYSGKIINEFAEHDDTLTCLLYLKGFGNNDYFLSSSRDKRIKLWNLNRNKSHRTFSSMGEVILMKHLKKFGVDYFASSGTDKSVNIWNALSGECIRNLKGFSRITNMVYPKEVDEEVIVISDDKHLKIFNFINGTLIKSIFNAHEDTISALMYSKTKEIIVSGCVDSNIKIWKLSH